MDFKTESRYLRNLFRTGKKTQFDLSTPRVPRSTLNRVQLVSTVRELGKRAAGRLLTPPRREDNIMSL